MPLGLAELVRLQAELPTETAIKLAIAKLSGGTPGHYVETFTEDLATRAIEKQKRTFADPLVWAQERGIQLWGRCSCEQCGGWEPEEAEDQLAIWEAVRENRETYVHSAFGTGKTFSGAGLACWWMDTFAPAIVLTTSGIFRQVRRQMWKDIRRLHRDLDLDGECHSVHWNITPEHYAEGFSTDHIDEMHGFHGAAVLFIIDEAQSERCRPAFDAAERILTGSNDSLLAICNPIRKNSVPYERMRANRGRHVRISALDCLSFQDAHPIRSAGLHELVSWTWMRDIADNWPEGSAKRRIHVDGLYAESDDEYVFPPDFVEDAMARWDVLHAEGRLFRESDTGVCKAFVAPDQIGIDVAGEGKDETIHASRFSMEAIAFTHREAKTNHPEHRKLCERLSSAYPSAWFTWDAAGEGSGTYGELRDRGVPIDRFVGGGAPADRMNYADRASEAYYALRDFMTNGGAIPRSEELKKQLQAVEVKRVDKAVRLGTGKHAIVRETTLLKVDKAAMKKALRHSPDEADACAMACTSKKGSIRQRGFRRHQRGGA
jgi:hypothetical protein